MFSRCLIMYRNRIMVNTFASVVLWNALFLYITSYNVQCLPSFTIDAYDHRNHRNDPLTELQLVQVVFRHGDRTPDQEEMSLYPDNPHINETFAPYGMKALTNVGKMREYKIGQFLRSHYKHLLSKEYLPEEIYVRSTDYDRTKMSALTCMAGLYPPTKSQMWNSNLRWQPIPYHTVDYYSDDMMYYYICPRFLEARTDFSETPEFLEMLEPYQDLFAEISEFVGRDIKTTEDVFYLDNLFQSEKNYNLTIPDWADRLMKEIKEITVLEYYLEFATDELKRVAGGQMLYKMIQDFKAKINGTMTPEKRKMFIYSGHENNVAAILACSGVFEPHQPPYGSTVLIELHKMLKDESYAVRILYGKDVTKDVQVLPIPGCGEFCEINKFIELTANTVTSDFREICPLQHP